MMSSKKNKIAMILQKNETFLDNSSSIAQSSDDFFLKNFIKQFGNLYYFLIRFFGPVFNHPMNQRKLREELSKYGESHVVVNLGSGPNRILSRQDIINIDLMDYKEVDIVAVNDKIPLKDGVVDFCLSIAVLEHVPSPEDIIAEIDRVLKPGGRAFVFVPFMQPFHAAPNDYHRWSRVGIEQLCGPLKIENSWVGGGPTSGFLWIFQTWVALLFSFGIRPLFNLIFVLLMLLTFPLKWLDLFLIYHPQAHQVSSGFYFTAVKSNESKSKKTLNV